MESREKGVKGELEDGGKPKMNEVQVRTLRVPSK
jgi:hypothetical protein